MAGRMKDGETARKGRRAARLITAALLALFAAWLIWGNTALMISRVTVKDEGIPAAFDGFRIAQVSDLHNAEFGKGNRIFDLQSDEGLYRPERPDLRVDHLYA